MFFYEYNQVLLWQVSSKTTSLKVNGLVHNGLIQDRNHSTTRKHGDNINTG